MVAYRPACRRGNGNLVSWRQSDAKAPPFAGSDLRARLFYLLVTFILACAAPASAKADPFKASVTADVSGGFARFIFTLSDDIDASAHAAGNVLIISFDKPVVHLGRASAGAGVGIYRGGAARSRRPCHPHGARA